MNAASLERSARLKRLHAYLRRCGEQGATTWQIAWWTRSCAVHSDVAELRANGVDVSCEYEGTKGGRRVYRYRLAA